jgi:hypothetical protein
MYQTRILLPLKDNEGRAFARKTIGGIQERLAERFGGYTAHQRAPAKGVWRQGGKRQTDDIVVLEVLSPKLDRKWWKAFRANLERELRQEEIVIYAEKIEKL